MQGARLALLVVTAILVAVACSDSEPPEGQLGAYFSRDPNAQATIRAEHPADTTVQISLQDEGVLHATIIVSDTRDGHTRTESRFWFNGGIVTHAEYEVYDAITSDLIETQTTSGGSTTSSEGWSLSHTEPEQIVDLLPALSAPFLIEVAEMVEVASSPSSRTFVYRLRQDPGNELLIEIEHDTNVILRERRTRNGEIVTDRQLSYEFLTGENAPPR